MMEFVRQLVRKNRKTREKRRRQQVVSSFNNKTKSLPLTPTQTQTQTSTTQAQGEPDDNEKEGKEGKISFYVKFGKHKKFKYY